MLALLLQSVTGHAGDPPAIRDFFAAASPDDAVAQAALDRIAENWRDGYAAMLVDLARFMMAPRRPTLWGPSSSRDGADAVGPGRDETLTGAAGAGNFPASDRGPRQPPHPSTRIRSRLLLFLEQQTGQSHGHNLQRWRRWYWRLPYEPHPDYALFKSTLYGQVDERMVDFFRVTDRARIRLDEIDWGGVDVNGIPPLDHPKRLSVDEAGYLEDGHIVFGIQIGDEAVAYPKRILAWHELALDEVGGTSLAVVYCTLCGSVIPYGSAIAGRHFQFGTSGLLYRSNKLMFDAETGSLWSTTEGRPVLGPLASEDWELRAYPVVTTTWGEWRALHPGTKVLSLDTGYERDYSEGAAYRDYFRTDRLMFAVPEPDDRLDNKDEVLALTLRPHGAPRQALAIAADLLGQKKNRVFHVRLADRELVVLTSRRGANRVYDAAGTRFVKLDGQRVWDEDGGAWTLREDALVAETDSTKQRPRIPARRAFWFGWHAQYPQTELIH